MKIWKSPVCQVASELQATKQRPRRRVWLDVAKPECSSSHATALNTTIPPRSPTTCRCWRDLGRVTGHYWYTSGCHLVKLCSLWRCGGGQSLKQQIWMRELKSAERNFKWKHRCTWWRRNHRRRTDTCRKQLCGCNSNDGSNNCKTGEDGYCNPNSSSKWHVKLPGVQCTTLTFWPILFTLIEPPLGQIPICGLNNGRLF